MIRTCLFLAMLATAPLHAAAPVAEAGSYSVSRADVETMLNALPPTTRTQLKGDKSALNAWLRERLTTQALAAEAQKQNWADKPEVKQLIDAATREVVMRSYIAAMSKVPDAYPSDTELQAAYEQGKASFQQQPQARVAQIWLAAPAIDADAVTKARKTADEVVGKARSKGADFAALVRQYSQDKEGAAKGGDTGFVPEPQLLPEVRQALAALKPGDISAPIQTATGLHILKLIERQPARTLTLDEVKPQLRDALRAQRQQQLAQTYVKGLIDNSKMKIDEAAIDSLLK